jgi:NitT/TauT family transport system substrate-binding protein
MGRNSNPYVRRQPMVGTLATTTAGLRTARSRHRTKAVPQRMIRRDFLQQLAALTAGSALGLSREAAAEPPPETTTIRINGYKVACVAPLFVADALLHAEGFKHVEYTPPIAKIEVGSKVDFDMFAIAPVLAALDAGKPIVTLAGIHLGCYELFGRGDVRGIRDLKGKTVPVDGLGNAQHVLLSSMAAYVGLNPHTDIRWAIRNPPHGMEMFAGGEADAYLAYPPEPYVLRAKGVGKVIVNTGTDKPWSQYVCCMLISHRDFALRHPIATKRAMRAILKAADLCASDPAGSARGIVNRGVTDSYDYAFETLREMQFDAWRSYDPEDAMRFHAVRLYDVGLIKTNPNKLISEGTNWSFLRELRRELKA